jgi:hypothetical protein
MAVPSALVANSVVSEASVDQHHPLRVRREAVTRVLASWLALAEQARFLAADHGERTRAQVLARAADLLFNRPRPDRERHGMEDEAGAVGRAEVRHQYLLIQEATRSTGRRYLQSLLVTSTGLAGSWSPLAATERTVRRP